MTKADDNFDETRWETLAPSTWRHEVYLWVSYWLYDAGNFFYELGHKAIQKVPVIRVKRPSPEDLNAN